MMIFGPVSVTAGSALERLELASVRPNPTRDQARIDFTLPHAGVIRLALHDVQGREVAVLAEGLHAAGRYQATWGGAGAGGKVGSGVYFLRLSTPAGERAQRFAVAR